MNPKSIIKLFLFAGAFFASIVLGAAPIKVACIGDSITYGYGIATRDTDSYPAQLQKMLGNKYEVRNFGNSGRGVYLHSMRGNEKRGYRFMKEHADALAWKPDIVVCNLGINDSGEFLPHELTNPGSFRDDYLKLLGDYTRLSSKPKIFIWGKLSPLAPGQKFYRAPDPFLMQKSLSEVAEKIGAITIDMQEPLRPVLLSVFPDKLHPNAAGAKIIAETVRDAILDNADPKKNSKVELPPEIARKRPEVWLCAGQSNMAWTLEKSVGAKAEIAATAGCDIWIWNFETGNWTKVTPANAGKQSSIAVSFAIRRAKASKKPVAILYVSAGGAPTEAFLRDETMAAIDSAGKPLFPNLLKIVTNRKQIDENEDFPAAWCAQEYRKRLNKNSESKWWGLGILEREGTAKIRHIPLTGILWYQGESNATTNIGADGGKPLPSDYMEETLRAIILELRPNAKTPFLMFGLPIMNRDWAPYRELQKKVCKDTGAVYLDTFGAGLGDKNDVHPRNKIPFAEMASDAATKALKKR